MGFWHWLMETGPFRVPQAAAGWSAGLLWATVVSNLLLFVVYATLPVMLLLLLQRLAGPPSFRRLGILAGLSLCGSGLMHLMRALSFIWPAYRLQVLANGVAAVLAWAALALLFPLAVRGWHEWHRQEIDALSGRLGELHREFRAMLPLLTANARELARLRRLLRTKVDKPSSSGEPA